MPRQLRLEFAGAFYHVMARGDRREAIFADDLDRQVFLRTLGETCERTGWRVHAWVLMGNHYHLLLETPEPNLVAGMQWLQNTYTRRFNVRHRLWGHLFGGRYKAQLVEGGQEAMPEPVASAHEGNDYFLAVLDYIHLNPVRARMVRIGEGNGLLSYPWSSLAQGYARPTRQRPAWLETSAALAAIGQRDHPKGRRVFVERLEARVQAEGARAAGNALPDGQTLNATLERGWYFGSQAFRERALEMAKALGHALGRRRESYEGAKVQRAHGQGEAERLLIAAVAALGMREEELASRPRGDRRAGLVAGLLRRRATVSLAWVAGRLGLRNAANAAQAIRRAEAEATAQPETRRLRQRLEQLS